MNGWESTERDLVGMWEAEGTGETGLCAVSHEAEGTTWQPGRW